MWHVTCEIPSSYGLEVMVFWRVGGKGWVYWINQLQRCLSNSPGYTGSVKYIHHTHFARLHVQWMYLAKTLLECAKVWARNMCLCGRVAIHVCARCISYSVHCTLYSVHCSLYSVHCTLYTVRYTLYTGLLSIWWKCPFALSKMPSYSLWQNALFQNALFKRAF